MPRLSPDAETVIVLANPVQPHSEGEIVLVSADPLDHPDIRMNYYDDPHDMEVMIAVLRRALEVTAHWPTHRADRPAARAPRPRRQARPRHGRHAAATSCSKTSPATIRSRSTT